MTYITQSTSKESGVGSRILVMAFVVLGIIAIQSRPVHAQWTTNGNNINNTNSGNVGIGTTTPGALLHGKRDQNTNTTVVIENADIGAAAYSSLEVRSGTTYADSIRVQAMGSSWPSNGAFAQDSGVITASANLSNGLSIMTQANAPIRFYTNGQAYERMRIEPSGNVGIGTAAPTAKLHILAPDETVAPALSLRQVSNPLYGFDFNLDNNINGNLSVNRVNNGTSTNLITLDRGAGNVGIGTATPIFDGNSSTAKYFTVNGGSGLGSIGAAGGTSSTGANVAQVAFVNSSLGTTEKRLATIVGSTDTATNSGNMDFYTAAAGAFPSSRMRITSAGNIGIGKTNPSTKLDVAGTVNATGLTVNGLPVTSSQWTTSGSNINYASGNVGIGTANPTEALDVIGSIHVSENINAKYQDLAEWVESSQSLSAGTVVVVDHTRSNQVIASSQAYDTRVAGVISLQPGITLGESGTGKVLVATTGRVKIKVDATAGPIQIGDLLVTSDKEGIAKKSKPLNLGGVQIHRPGTLIGKALEPLAKGTGEILVLLSLQ